MLDVICVNLGASNRSFKATCGRVVTSTKVEVFTCKSNRL